MNISSEQFIGILRYVSLAIIRGRGMYFIASLITLVILGRVTLEVTPGLSESAQAWGRAGVSNLGSILIFIMLFSVSSVGPRMFSPGAAGFFVGKPLSRARLLTYLIITLNIVVALVMIASFAPFLAAEQWLGAQTAAWDDVLLQILLEFAIFVVYSPLLVWLSIRLGSGSLAVMGCFVVWLGAWLVAVREPFLGLIDNQVVVLTLNALYFILPKSREISELGLAGHWNFLPLLTSMAFAIAVWGIAVWRFREREF